MYCVAFYPPSISASRTTYQSLRVRVKAQSLDYGHIAFLQLIGMSTMQHIGQKTWAQRSAEEPGSLLL